MFGANQIMPRNPVALPVAYVVLRILILLNWLYAGVLVTILVASVTSQQWTFRALGVPVADLVTPLLMGMRAIAVLGLVTVPMNLAMLERLVAIVRSVRSGDPFVAANAYRLNAIAWILLGLQLISLAVWAIGKAASTPRHPLHLNAGVSTAGWLAVFLTFVLARVFAEGALMREDLKGTV
jgi:signal transduction histidine kinase